METPDLIRAEDIARSIALRLMREYNGKARRAPIAARWPPVRVDQGERRLRVNGRPATLARRPRWYDPGPILPAGATFEEMRDAFFDRRPISRERSG